MDLFSVTPSMRHAHRSPTKLAGSAERGTATCLPTFCAPTDLVLLRETQLIW